jgi:hypothetical protein
LTRERESGGRVICAIYPPLTPSPRGKVVASGTGVKGNRCPYSVLIMLEGGLRAPLETPKEGCGVQIGSLVKREDIERRLSHWRHSLRPGRHSLRSVPIPHTNAS